MNGIIFDMDNTILASKIDFAKMKAEVAAFVSEVCGQGADFSRCSTGQVIDWGLAHGLSPEDEAAVWELVADLEALGMVRALAEHGAAEALARLERQALLTVLTNNAKRAALLALENVELTSYFSQIYAREDIGELKPSPLGIERIVAENPRIERWLVVGDSWLDGQAARNAARRATLPIDFAAYGDKSPEYWESYQVEPALSISRWDRAGVLCIIDWLRG